MRQPPPAGAEAPTSAGDILGPRPLPRKDFRSLDNLTVAYCGSSPVGTPELPLTGAPRCIGRCHASNWALYGRTQASARLSGGRVYVGNIWAATKIITFLIGAFRPDVNAGVAEGYIAALFVAGFPVAIHLA